MPLCRLLAALAVLLSIPAAHAQQSACERWGSPALAEGPITLGFQSADVATGRRACARTEVGLGAEGSAIIETKNLFGAITAAGLVSGSLAVRPDLEVFATLEAPRFQYVQNASFTGSALYLGQLTVGGTWALLSQGNFVLAPSARLQLPTSFASPRIRTTGAELGAALLLRPNSYFEAHGYVGVDSSLALGDSAALPRVGALVNLGIEYAFSRHIALALDANAHFGYRAAFDSLAPSLGLRLAFGDHFGAELGATVPVLGVERALAAAGLKFTWRL